ncbi:hypothetical protein BWQ96_05392 [Gracilariopsis chorda]|uniref:Uncharacterized protein n=1 Tax=Gracilariopsis chorda TaxID=448386 RepID=A0A2V3IS14_9FLOR|nr:hypothetical protein BWQ96_05392 [Gracilariopsis chorda]|eukprot:PXF44902.1 hypothetical protein BWQ96_05392 [Gracilariopsis chorda]
MSSKHFSPEFAPGMSPSSQYFVKRLAPCKDVASLLPFLMFSLEGLVAVICSYIYQDTDWLLKFTFSQLLAINTVFAGILHFYKPLYEFYTSMIFVPFKDFWLYSTGFVLMFGGFGLVFANTQVLAAYALAGVLIVMFPGNIACVFLEKPRKLVCNDSLIGAVLRLPMQLVFIRWALWFTTPPLPPPF